MKRAFIDITLELLTQLLHLNDDVMVIHAEPRFEQGAVLRLHLRGDGLPEKTDCQEGEQSHWLTRLDEIMKPQTPKTDPLWSGGPDVDEKKIPSIKCSRCRAVLNNLSPGFGLWNGKEFCMPCLQTLGISPDKIAKTR